MIKIHAHPDTRLPVHVRHGAHYTGTGEAGWYLTGPAIGPVDLVLIERPDFDDTDPDEAADELAARIELCTVPAEDEIRALAREAEREDETILHALCWEAIEGNADARQDVRDVLIRRRADLEAEDRALAEVARAKYRPRPVNLGADAIRSTYPSKAHMIARIQWRETDDPNGGSWWRVDALDSRGAVIASAFVGDGDGLIGVYLPGEIEPPAGSVARFGFDPA